MRNVWSEICLPVSKISSDNHYTHESKINVR